MKQILDQFCFSVSSARTSKFSYEDETILKYFPNISELFCFSFVSHARTSEIKLFSLSDRTAGTMIGELA